MADVRTEGRPVSRQRENPAWLEVVRAHNEPKIRVLASQIRYAEKLVELSVGRIVPLLAAGTASNRIAAATEVVQTYERVLARLRQTRERLVCEVRGVPYNPERVDTPPPSESVERMVMRHRIAADRRERRRLRDRRLAQKVVPRQFVDVTRVVQKDDKIHFYWPEDHPLHGHAIYERLNDGTCGRQIFFRPFGVKRAMKEIARRVHEERLLEMSKDLVLPGFRYGARPVRVSTGGVSIRVRYPQDHLAVLLVRDENLSDTLRVTLSKDGEVRSVEWK